MGSYTLAQLESFLAAIDQEDRARNRVALIAARAAQAKAESFTKILREMG